MIFQTLTAPEEHRLDAPPDLPLEDRGRLVEAGWPRLSFVEHSFASDPTNWWIPNLPCCEAMIRAAGLRVTASPGHEIYICERTGTPTLPAEAAALR